MEPDPLELATSLESLKYFVWSRPHAWGITCEVEGSLTVGGDYRIRLRYTGNPNQFPENEWESSIEMLENDLSELGLASDHSLYRRDRDPLDGSPFIEWVFYTQTPRERKTGKVL